MVFLSRAKTQRRKGMLKIESLRKTYPNGAIALDDLSFAIEPHTFTAILGSSGAGKTTLMRCILQLLKPDQGRVWFQGRDLTVCSAKELRQSRAQIATVAQQFNLVRRRTALEKLSGRTFTRITFVALFS